MQAYEKGLLNLRHSISKYLPELRMSWKDSISIHHLLTHQHGIQSLDKKLQFPPGSEFKYSQLGYELLARILEQVHQKDFSKISNELFQQHNLTKTFHPASGQHKNLVNGYSEDEQGKLIDEPNSFQNYTAAGGFVSNALDLVQWNLLLHNGSLVKKHTLQLMRTKYATRQHPIFDAIDYGYGLTFGANEANFQIGALGFAPGFVSSNFYFPETGTSVVLLQNTAVRLNDFKQTFYYHTTITNLVREAFKIKQ